jgi:flagellar hook-length control protein FliK
MNGNAINPVLLNISQRGSGTPKSSTDRDADSADFAQALHQQQASARAQRNEIADRLKAARASEARDHNAQRDHSSRVADRHNPGKANPPIETPESKSAQAHSVKPRTSGKTEGEERADQVAPSCTAADKPVDQKDSIDYQLVDKQEGEADSELSSADASQESKVDSSLVEGAETSGALSLHQLLASKASNKADDPDSTGTTDVVANADDQIEPNVGETGGLTLAMAEATETDNKTKSFADDDAMESSTTDSSSQDSALLLQEGNGLQAATVPSLTTLTPNTTPQNPEGELGQTAAKGVATPSAMADIALAATNKEADDASPADEPTLPGVQKDDALSVIAKTTASAATDEKSASDESASTFDKNSFEKMFKAMAQSSGGDTVPREQAAPSATQSPASSTAVEFAGRPQESLSATGLRNFVVQTSVPTPVGQPQWSQAVGEKVLWLAAQNISSAEINLHPQDLGPVQVKVSVNQDQANVTFTSHHAVVREVLDQNLNRLRDMFSEQGLNLVNVDVSDRSFQRQQNDGKEHQGQGSSGGSETEEETLVAVSTITSQRLVDHYA